MTGAVVVPGISAPSSTAVCRSLGKRGIYTIVVSEHENAAAFRSRYCDEAHVVPDPHADLSGYINTLLGLAERDSVRTIVPVREVDIYALSTHREAFAEHIATPWPSFGSLRQVQDRLALADAAEQAGVAMPETQACTEWQRWDQPTIVKARYSLLADTFSESQPIGRVSGVPKTEYFNSDKKPDLDTVINRMGHIPIAQEYVDNTNEYGFFALYDRGKAVATFQHRQLRAYHYSGGPSAFRESVSIPDLERAGRALLDSIDWHGLAMVEFLRDQESGEFKLMEVNPRFWSSLPFSIRSGADFPYYYWLLANELSERIECTYEIGTAGHLLRGEMIYLYSVFTEEHPLVERPDFAEALREVLESIFRHPRFDYLVRVDPIPFIQDLRNAWTAIRNPTKGPKTR